MVVVIMTTDGMVIPGIFKKAGEEVRVSDELAIVLKNKGMAKEKKEEKVEAVPSENIQKTATKK